MVCLRDYCLARNKNYNFTLPSLINPIKLSSRELQNYLATHDIPKKIASPWPRLSEQEDYVSGKTGDLIRFGAEINGMIDFGTPWKKETRDEIANLYHANWHDGFVEFDTYFNKILEESIRRGIVTLRHDSDFLFDDVRKIQIAHYMNRYSSRDTFWDCGLRSYNDIS